MAGDLNSDSYLALPDFVCFRSDRKKPRGGGVALLIHKDLHPTEVSTPAITLKSNDVNIVTCTIHSTSIKSKAVRICILYMPPTTPISDLRQVQSALFYLVDKSQGPLIIMGDLNLPNTDWYSKRPTNTGNAKNSIFTNFGT